MSQAQVWVVAQFQDIYSHVLDKTLCCPSIPIRFHKASDLKYQI